MYRELQIGGETYKLRLNTRACINLEKSLGYNPVALFLKTDFDNGDLPKMQDMITILHAALQANHHGYTMDKTYDLFDRYAEDGHMIYDLIPIFMEVFEMAGLISIPKGEEEEPEKN